MRNEGADIVQDIPEETAEWKSKAKIAGTAARDAAKAAYQEIQQKSVAYSKATDHAIRENPYWSVGIAFGAGCLLGFLLTRGGDEE